VNPATVKEKRVRQSFERFKDSQHLFNNILEYILVRSGGKAQSYKGRIKGNGRGGSNPAAWVKG